MNLISGSMALLISKTCVIGQQQTQISCYRAMLEDYLRPELDKLDINNMWFQQDGATSHTALVTIDLLKSKFGECVISRNGPVEWPSRLCDLTPYFCVLFIDKIVMSLLENPLVQLTWGE